MFDRLHQEDKRRREQQAEQLAAQQQAELDNCTFAPSLADSASFERLLTPRQNAAEFAIKTNVDHTFQPQINEYEVRTEAGGRMALPVYERLAADAQRAKEKQRALEEHYANLRLEGVTFRPDLPESSRRMSSSIGAAKEVFERLQQQKSPAPAAVTTPSRHASFSSRSLVKPSEATETELSDLLRSQQQQQSNGSGEAEKVYSRLTERAQKAAEKLRELRADPDKGKRSSLSLSTDTLPARSLSRSGMASQSKAVRPPEPAKSGGGSSTAEDLFSRLTDRAKKAASVLRERGEAVPSSSPAPKTPSAHSNFLTRSLVRSKSISSGAAQPEEPQSVKLATASAPNTPAQEDSLFQRLTQRANKAADKLRSLSIKETTPLKPTSRSSLSLNPTQQATVARLSLPKRSSISSETNEESTNPPVRKSSLSSSSKIPTRSISNEASIPRLSQGSVTLDEKEVPANIHGNEAAPDAAVEKAQHAQDTVVPAHPTEFHDEVILHSGSLEEESLTFADSLHNTSNSSSAANDQPGVSF